MRLIYQISIYLYYFAVRISSLFNPKAKAWIEGRKNLKWEKFDSHYKKVVWFHCASLGEFDIGIPLIEKWQQENPDDVIVVTFFSPSGMQNYQKRNLPIEHVFYLPLDTPKNAKTFVQTIRPNYVIFVKYEFWAFHLFEAQKYGAKIFSVNTLFRKNQMYFKWYGNFYRQILNSFDHFFVQNKNSIDLLESIQIKNATISGDLRFDRVYENKQKVTSSTLIENWLEGEKVFIIGSSWPVDEKILFELINSERFKQKVIIAPHEINESHIKEIEKLLRVESIRFTDCEDEINRETKVLILNTIGHLTNSFQYGDVAYIGGGFTGKLHNILEPAVFGLPILFGPKHDKFPEAQLFIDKGFAFEVADIRDFKIKFDSVHRDKKDIESKLLQFMKGQIGVSVRILKQIQSN
ncbi:MAG: glycosyltransferase N-terminal domain-containing protein [Crocinitomicaceae bacterium]|nr:glycosyltransferase N-terminal domain-containing protein [Crocinitomicaceae bacterium]